MKKLIYLTILTLLLAGCNIEAGGDNDEPKVAVTTTFINDMVKVLDADVDSVDLNLIIPAGEDPHVYEPRASDLRTINEADIVFYHGLDFEGRMATVLESGVSITENFNYDSLPEMEEDEETVVDPHFWFDIDLYKQAFATVKDELIELNPDFEAEYKENYEAYLKELDELDDYVNERIQEIPESSRVILTPHDAFGYLERRYDIEVHAPQGFSTDSEVSNHQIQQTANLIIDRDVKAIFVETTTNPDRMIRLQEVVNSEGGEVDIVSDGNELLTDSMAPEGESGDTFITMFRHNIDIIVEHLK